MGNIGMLSEQRNFSLPTYMLVSSIVKSEYMHFFINIFDNLYNNF